ncbi:hypothetical protein L2K70_01630 [Nocardioides KLBMP 9356]|uniref:Uncharacterized protein n=1 Tax=Nocardioides potassii TaxID=2911371 RepID=A0ABS9H8E8_9ACTN|nr:hypothetical protein [Nocardioides potassii]MCF6376298.1 hypothetical protein [Nocardioides potassii]
MTWAANNNNADSNNTTQSGTVAGNTISVVTSYTGTLGGLAPGNMANNSTGGVGLNNFELVNVIPQLLSNGSQPTGIAGNFSTTTFTFTKLVSSLTFSIEDIDHNYNPQPNGAADSTTQFFDQVAILPATGATVSAVLGSQLTGSGTLASPWRTTGRANSYIAEQTATVTITGGFKSFSIRYWTTEGATSANANMWVRIRSMTVSSCST